MSTISHNDFILATEMQLIYNNVAGFEPVNNNLSHWKGTVGVIEGTSIPIYADIVIPPDFPNRPPKITITPKLNHPNVDDNGNISLRITAHWVPTVHVYEIINELRKLFSRVPAKPYKTKKQRRVTSQATQSTRLPVHPIPTYPVHPQAFTNEQAMNQEEVEKRTLQEEIEEYQRQIEELNQEIEKERISLLQQGGVSVAKNGKELSISREDDLKAELFATKELLETLKDKFEDGDLSAVDYFKLYKKYSKGEYTAEKKLSLIKSKESGMMTEGHEKQMDLEAELFATIATLDTLAKSYENNEIEQVAYKKQLRALIKDIFKIRMKLERITKFDITEFIEREKLDEKYPKGIKHLRMAEGTETAEAEVIPFETLKKMPAKTADFVSAAIELLDLTRLRSVAKAELILADLEEMLHILSTFPAIKRDHWMIEDMKNWKDIISNYKPQEVIKEQDCEKLEFQAARWLNEFRRMLKDL